LFSHTSTYGNSTCTLSVVPFAKRRKAPREDALDDHLGDIALGISVPGPWYLVFIKDTEFHLLSPAHCAVTYVDFYTRRQASSFRDGQFAPEGSSRGSLSRSVENTSHLLF
jgi:hypothetical protein